MRDFIEDPNEEILGKSKFSGLGGVLDTSYHSTTLKKVGILPTFVYFHHLGCFKGGCLYRCPKGVVWLFWMALMVVLRPVCDRLCELNCGCL